MSSKAVSDKKLK